jgi:opacity protein-like surface antigen
MLSRTALLAATAVALCGSAQARGWYVGLEAGANWVTDSNVRFYTAPGATPLDLTGRFDGGWAVIATVGYGMQNWRIEGELAWRTNDKDRFTALPISTGDLDGLTAMYNMTYAFPLSPGLNLALGGGAGLDYASLDIVNIDDSDLNFAYQGIVTLDYTLSPTTELTVGYRYLHVLDPEFEDGTVRYKFDDFSKHALTIGMRYTFAP